MVDVVNNLLSEKHESYSQSLYLVCGILKTPSHKELYLPWSPLRKASTIYQSTQKLAMEWILNRLSLAVTAFDERARYIWTLEWPEPCLYFLSSSTSFTPNHLWLNLIVDSQDHVSKTSRRTSVVSRTRIALKKNAFRYLRQVIAY